MLCALLLGFQSSPVKDAPGRTQLDQVIARFSQTTPIQISFKVNSRGGRPFTGIYQRESPQVERYTLTGPGAHFEYRHRKSKAIEIDHTDKSYEFWPFCPEIGLLGEGEDWFGASSVPIFLQHAGRNFLKTLGGVRQSPGQVTFSFKQGETETKYAIKVNASGALTDIERTLITLEGETVTLWSEFTFGPLPAGPASRFSVDAPPRYFPNPIRSHEWPLQKGDTLPTLPGVNSTTRLVAFVDPEDSRSNQLVTWLNSKPEWKPKTTLIGIGRARSHPQIKHWLDSSSAAAQEIGLSVVPTIYVIQPGRVISWVHVGFGPSTQTQVKTELETRMK